MNRWDDTKKKAVPRGQRNGPMKTLRWFNRYATNLLHRLRIVLTPKGRRSRAPAM